MQRCPDLRLSALLLLLLLICTCLNLSADARSIEQREILHTHIDAMDSIGQLRKIKMLGAAGYMGPVVNYWTSFT